MDFGLWSLVTLNLALISKAKDQNPKSIFLICVICVICGLSLLFDPLLCNLVT